MTGMYPLKSEASPPVTRHRYGQAKCIDAEMDLGRKATF